MKTERETIDKILEKLEEKINFWNEIIAKTPEISYSSSTVCGIAIGYREAKLVVSKCMYEYLRQNQTIPVQEVDENAKVPTLSSELISFAIDNGFSHRENKLFLSKNIGVVTHSLWIINGEYELSGFNNHEATSIYETGFQPIVLDEAKLLITTFQKSIK